MFAPANKAALSYIPLPARIIGRFQFLSVQFMGEDYKCPYGL